MISEKTKQKINKSPKSFKALLNTIEEKFENALYEKEETLFDYRLKKLFVTQIMDIYRKVRNHECKLVWEKEKIYEG